MVTITTNVPAPELGPRGFVSPAQQAVLEGVQADMNAAFDGNLNPSLTTPQGQQSTTLTAVIGQANDQFCNIVNQMDPAYASGRMQDAIGRIYFITRKPSQPTIVQAVCSGLTGVVIPIGALARADDGNVYTSTEQGVIPDSGSVTISFACNIAGPIQCPAHTLTTIYRAINGWDSIDNPSDGVVGTETESRQAFEDRRAASVAGNSIGALPSVLGSVLSVDNVLDAYVTDNDTSSPVTKGGVTLAANSLYVAAVGGTDLDVATAIWKKKAPGCGYNGNTTVTVVDSRSGYSPPLPTYNVTFERPDPTPILFAVTLVNNPLVPADAETQIQAAMIAAFAGADGGSRARIGSTILALRYVQALYALGAWVQLFSIFVGSQNDPLAQFTGSISGTTLTVASTSSGAVAIGQTIIDPDGGVAPGTVVTAGSNPTWTVSVSQTVTSRALVATKATESEVQVNIDQVPTLSASSIAIALV